MPLCQNRWEQALEEQRGKEWGSAQPSQGSIESLYTIQIIKQEVGEGGEGVTLLCPAASLLNL